MTQATVTRLSSAHFPWCYALRIHQLDSDTFHAVIGALKEAIPARRRKWDSPSKRWLVRDGEQETLISILRQHGVDYDLEDESRQHSHHRPALTRVEAAATLHLLPDAPSWAIDALYRAAAKRCHPDAGGDTEQMQRLNLAVEVLRESK